MEKNRTFKTFGIPNWLSVLRLALIPVFVAVFFSQAAHARLAAGVILVVSGITDVLDGIIARKFNMTSKLGQILDPFADKLTQAAVCICLVVGGVAPWWLLTVFVVKELVMIGAGARVIREGKALFSAKWFGKLGTVVFYIVMVAIIVVPMPAKTKYLLIGISLFFMIFSFIMYIPVYIGMYIDTASKKGRDDR